MKNLGTIVEERDVATKGYVDDAINEITTEGSAPNVKLDTDGNYVLYWGI